jgi:hypothetical protein
MDEAIPKGVSAMHPIETVDKVVRTWRQMLNETGQTNA